MNWYELASVDEVKETLEQFLVTYSFATRKFDYYTRDKEGNPDSWIVYPPQAYEIAEALWGEYSEEVF